MTWRFFRINALDFPGIKFAGVNQSFFCKKIALLNYALALFRHKCACPGVLK
jgi:hypothetical protein